MDKLLNHSMPSSMFRSKALKIVLLGLISLLALELLAKGAVYFLLRIEDGNYRHYYQNDPQLNLLTWTENHTAHPYFGYESPTTIASEKILSEVTDDDFVIGILGGSVAGAFAEYSISNPSPFESVMEASGKKHLIIVNLANGGYKQPQQFFAAVYFMEKLDLIINIDGFNDASGINFLPVYPLEFPNFPRFYGRAGTGGIYGIIARTTQWVYKTITHAPTTWKLPGLSRSSSYFLGWYYGRDVLYRIVKLCEAGYYESEFGIHQSGAKGKLTPSEILAKRLAIWKKYTILEDDLLRKRTGKPVFFFVQPNQYLKNSKLFSEEEKHKAFEPSRMEPYHELMTSLRTAAAKLRHDKVPIFDLTGIFSDTTETVYLDSCCHLNDLGNQIMQEAVVGAISKTLPTKRTPRDRVQGTR